MGLIDLEKVVKFSNGVQVINCTPHAISFLDGDEVVVVEPCGATLKATPQETLAGQYGTAQLVKTIFLTSPEGEEDLAILAGVPALVVGSMVSAQAYPGRVVAMTPAPGYERVPIDQKRMSISKFTVF